MDETDKATQRRLKSLQRKWIEKMAESGKGEEGGGGLTMDFSEIQAAEAKKKKKKKTEAGPEKAPPEKPAAAVPAEEPVREERIELPLGEEAGGVDYELINEMVTRAVHIEVERAIRELKEEIRTQSDITRKELYEQVRLDLETLRQEIEFSSKTKRQKGLFERF